MAKSLLVYQAAGSGQAFWGPGDMYTFLITGEQTGGAYFVMEALVPPGGGPPPHIHTNEDETFYVVEGQCAIMLGDTEVLATAGDFVNIPKGTVHCFHNDGTVTARLIVTFTPAGMEGFFRETLEPATDRTIPPPGNNASVAAKYIAAAPKYGLEFVALAQATAA